MIDSLLIALYVVTAICLVVNAVYTVIAARYRKPGVSFIRASLFDTLLKKPSSYTKAAMKARKRAIAWFAAAWGFGLLAMAMLGVAMWCGELPLGRTGRAGKHAPPSSVQTEDRHPTQ